MAGDAPCVFCEIVAGRAPASIIYQDEVVLAMMGIRPIHPGECMVIPRQHIDHFTDIDDELTQHLLVIAQRIGRRMREVFRPQRVGMVVHGFGVPHAHLLLIPLHRPDDITSGRFAYLAEDGSIAFGVQHLPLAERSLLDEHARLLAEPDAAATPW